MLHKVIGPEIKLIWSFTCQELQLWILLPHLSLGTSCWSTSRVLPPASVSHRSLSDLVYFWTWRPVRLQELESRLLVVSQYLLDISLKKQMLYDIVAINPRNVELTWSYNPFCFWTTQYPFFNVIVHCLFIFFLFLSFIPWILFDFLFSWSCSHSNA